MSNYNGKAVNPATGKVEDAIFLDDFYGKHKYAVKFNSGNIWPIEDVKIINTPPQGGEGGK